MKTIVKILLLTTIAYCLPIESFAQSKNTVSGYVVDERGEPVIGITIMVKGEIVGTVADIDGKFTLNYSGLSDDTILVINMPGFKPQEITVRQLKNNGGRIEMEWDTNVNLD